MTAVGVLLLMAPSVYHRVRWNEGGKEDVINVGHRLFLAGTFFLALGLLLAVFLIGDLLFGPAAASAALALPLVVVVVTWYALPLRRARDPRISEQE
jgi:membrane protein implicated in regulation of membrane protease activity